MRVDEPGRLTYLKLKFSIYQYTFDKHFTKHANMNRGVIYCLTSPNGKKYYGQTTMPPEQRWNNHFHASRDDRMAHYPLYAAIREFGWENFTKEVVAECEDFELNVYEIAFIKDDNTLVPNGYNSRPGGQGKVENLPDEYQQFYYQNVRKHTNYDLPQGISEINLPQRDEYGFKVYVDGTTHDFISKHQSMEEKYQSAMECYDKLKRGEQYRRANHHKWDKAILNELGIDVPEGIKYRKDKEGFEVHVKINGVVYRKTFTKKKFTLQQNLASATAYLHNLRQQQ